MAAKPNYTLDRRLLDKIIAGQKSPTTGSGYQGAPADTGFKGTAYDDNSGPSVFSRGLDLLSRPLYAVQNLIKDTVDPNEGTNNPLESLWAGFSGIDKTTGSDVIQKMDDVYFDTQDVPDWVKGLGGFVSDVALDPLTWTTFGIGGLVKKGAKAAHEAASGTEKYNAALRSGEGGLTEFTPKEIANRGGTVEGQLGDTAKLTEKEAKAQQEAAVEATNAARRADTGEAVVEEAKVNPVSTAEELGQPRVPKEEDLGVGTPWKPGDPMVANDYAQAATVQKITRKASTDASRASLDHGERTFFMRKQLSDQLAASKTADMARGIYPVVKHGDNHYAIHASDVFDALGDALNKVHLSNYDKVPTSSLLQGAARTLEGRMAGLSGDELLESVKEAIIKGHKTRNTISPRRAEVSAKALIANGEKLEAHLIANEKAMGKRDLVTGEALGTKVASDTARVVNDPQAAVSDALGAAADIKGSIIREGREQGLSPGGMAIGGRAADDALRTTLQATDEAGARATLGAAKDVGKGKPQNVQGRQSSQARKDAKATDDEIAKAEEKAVYVDLGEKMAINLDKGFHRLYAGLLGGVVHGFRMGNLANMYRLKEGTQEVFQKLYVDKLGTAVKTHGDDVFHQAINAVNAGIKITRHTDPVMAAAMRDAKELTDHVFSPDGLAGNIWGRQGMSIDTFNALTDTKGLKKWNLKKNESGYIDADSMAEMRQWAVDDWPDFLARMQSAALEASTRKAVGNDFARLFGHTEFKPGMVKIAKTDYAKAPMSHFTDNSKWYYKDELDMMHRFNNQIDASTGYAGSNKAVKGFVDTLDRYARVWKPSVTIFRLGHHVKNFNGDGMMNYVAGVKSPKHYENAVGAMRSSGQFTGDIKELEKLFNAKDFVDNANGAKKIATVTLKGGKTVDLTHAQLYQTGLKNGILPTFRTGEDILQSGGKTNIVDRATNKMMNSKPAQMAGKLSEQNNHLHSLAQMSHLMSNKKFTSKFDTYEEAAQAAATEVLKWHPNAAGLTKTEAKYGRRAVPFYTWFRQAIPRLMVATLDHPGRITAFPKATYGFQQSIGMEPESYSEPFSSKESLPNFMKGFVSGNMGLDPENPIAQAMSAIGVDTSNFGVNLGSPAESLAGIFSNGPQQTNPIQALGSNLAGMANPLLTLPFEFGEKKDLSGKFISDTSENIDQAIPFASTIGGITGYSPTGTVGNIFSSQPNTPVLDPQRANLLGEKDFLLNTNTWNFLTGMGLTNVNTPRYTNMALKEGRS